jgi:predicted MFS family arabinose efflux permease
VTEATTWVMTANVAGGALGAAIGGVVVQEMTVRAALVVACAGPALGTLIVVLRRRSLTEPGRSVAVPQQRAA